MYLLKNKTIDKILISDITTAVGVNRQTFYYHFTDIFDQGKVDYSPDEMIQTLLKMIEENNRRETIKQNF